MQAVQLEPIVTIDDLEQIAEVLHKGLQALGNYKYPLAIRKGVRNMADKPKFSKTVKAGAITYFFDVRETKGKDKKPYLVITESRFKGEGEDRERKAIFVFPEQAKAFSKAVVEMVTRLK